MSCASTECPGAWSELRLPADVDFEGTYRPGSCGINGTRDGWVTESRLSDAGCSEATGLKWHVERLTAITSAEFCSTVIQRVLALATPGQASR